MENLAKLIEDLFEQCDSHLPISNSLIPLRILAKTIHREAKDEDLTLKMLCRELKSSDLCTRTHINKLEKHDWLKLEHSNSDARVKMVKSTPKLVETFKKISDELKHSI